MHAELYIVRYVASDSSTAVPFGIVVYGLDEVHWQFVDDLSGLISDPEDLEVIAGTSELFAGIAQTIGPQAFMSWLTSTCNLGLRLEGPHTMELDSDIDECLLRELSNRHLASPATVKQRA